VRDTGSDLDPERGDRCAQCEHVGQRWGVGVRVEQTGAGAGPSRRVREDAADPVRVKVGTEAVGVPDFSVREVSQVDGRQCGGELVQLETDDPEAERRHRHRVAADPGREVSDRVDPGCREALCVPCCDGEPGGLLETRLGEEHAVGEVGELGVCLRAQPRLGQRRCNELGIDPPGAQPLGDRHRP